MNKTMQSLLHKAEYKILDIRFNSSSHNPVSLKIQIKVEEMPTILKNNKKSKTERYIWSKMDKELYNETMEACLSTESPISDIDVAIEYQIH